MGSPRSLSLPVRVLLGAVLGVLTGLFFGDYCAILRVVGQAYVMCLQGPVYPYLMAALIYGVGVLQPATAWKLVRGGGLFLLLLWGAAYALLFALAQFIPTPTPRLLDPAADSQNKLLALLIPANVDLAITHNYLPAVVLFSIVFGAALQAAPNKQPLLEICKLVKAACVKVWNWVVQLAPLGVFALTADTAGTLPLAALHQALLYLALFFGGVLLLLFWVLPALLTALAPLRYREIFNELKAPLALAFVTTLSVAALPFIQQSVEKLAGPKQDEEDPGDLSSTIVSLAYVFGQLGNGFVYLFVLFAAFYFGHPLTTSQQVVLPPVSVPASFGSPSASVNEVSFFANWLGLPHATTGLYVELMTVTRYGQVAVSVASFFFLAMLMALAYHGRLQVRPRTLVLHLGLLALMCGGLALAGRFAGPLAAETHGQRLMTLSLPPALTRGVEATVVPDRPTAEPPRPAPPGEDALSRVWRTGTLRVGYDDHLAPSCYRNDQGQLVGFDVAVAYEVARSLAVRLEFVPLHWDRLVEELEQGQYDLALAGNFPGAEWSMKLSLTNTYHVGRVGLLVRSEQQNDFLRINDIASRPGLRLGVFANTMPAQWAAQRFPQARLVPMTPGEMGARTGEWDAFVVMTDFAEAWAGSHPGYVAVVPEGLPIRVPLSYLAGRGSPAFVQCLNHCLAVQQAEGFLEQQTGYWMHGRPLAQPGRRWCVGRDVLHWLP